MRKSAKRATLCVAMYSKRVVVVSAAAVPLAMATFAQAAGVAPYAVDANTMHLWHLDDATTPAADSAHYNYAGTFTTKPDANQPLNALFGGATLGNASFSGFGNALNVGAAGAGLAALTPINGTGDNADHTFDNPTTHAFTFEAIIKIGFDPTATYAAPQEIIAGEGDAGDSSDRSWQFRLEPHAVAADPWRLRFQKVSGFGGAGGSTANYNLDAVLPTTGDNAIAQNGWYHVAATFTGDLADTTNLKLFWTKLDAGAITANQVAAGQMNGWLRQQDTDFALGNELRDFNGNTEGFIGMIDEVRISDIARSASAFYFQPAGATYWNVDADGSWDAPASWTAAVPNAVSASAIFGGGGTAITAPRTITLSGTKTLGFLGFNNATNGYTLAGASGALALDNGAAPAQVLVQAGTHTISVPVTLSANGAVVTVSGSGDKLTINGSVNGAGGLAKMGAGVLVLAANNNYGTTQIAGGTVQIGTGGATGTVGSGDITATNGGVLAVNRSGNYTLTNNFTGNGSIRQDGTGVLTISGTNGFTGGGVIATAGSVKLGSAGALANGGVTLNNGSSLDLNGFSNGTGGLLNGNGTITDNSAGAGTTTFTVGAGSGEFSGSISDGPTRKIALVRSGAGNTRLSGSNNYTGGTTITRGFFEVFNNNALGSGPIVINPAVTLPAVQAESAHLTLGDGITLSNTITMTTSNADVAVGTIQTIANASATVSGPITILGDSVTGGHFASNGTGVLRVTGAITAGPAVTNLIIRAGNIELSGGGSYPELQIRAGNTAITAANGVATNAVVDLAGNGSLTTATTLELAGSNQTIAGLKNSVGVNNAALVVDSLGGSTLTLAVGAGKTQTYGGSISGGLNLRITSGTQILTKLGTSTLNGVYDYTGSTTVEGGKLQLGTTATGPIFGGQGVDIRQGSVVFDYTGGTTPAATVVPILDAGFSQGTPFSGGAIRSSTATAGRGLGYRDDPATSTFTVMYTLYGDASLNGTVGFEDLVSLAQNYNLSGRTWSQGDSNYDFVVDFADLVQLAQNYNLTVLPTGEIVATGEGGDFAADWALAQSLVPEPTSLAMMLGLAGTCAARRRRVAGRA
jgi:autotransporter-associated beta strand protein